MNDETDLPSPSLPRRLVAMVYDTFLVLPLVMLSVALCLGAHTLLVGSPPENTVVQLNANLVRFVALVTVMVFFSAFWMRSGQTLGMQAWRIKLVSVRGDRVTAVQAILRCLGAALSAAALGLGYLWCLVDRQGRCWHDYLSGSKLVLLPRREKRRKPKTGTPA